MRGGRALSSVPCSNNIFAATMAGSHVGFSVLSIEEEQKEIDKLISSLLEYKPATKDNSSPHINSPQQKSTPVAASKIARNRGRPPKPKPVSSSSPVETETSHGNRILPSMELIITCMEKLNNQNKILINKVIDLESVVQNQCSKGPTENNTENPSVSETAAPSSPVSSAVIKSVVEKVYKIEENLNSRLLICRGPTVSRKIAASTENSQIDFGKLKAELCADICGREITKISVGSFGISLFGRNRDMLKVDCNNISIKKHLLNQAREKKPKGIYLVEFLSPYKRKIHNKLVTLRKENPSRLKAVYIRGGVIYGKVGQDTLKFESLVDVDNIDLDIPDHTELPRSTRSPVPDVHAEVRIPNSTPPSPALENNGNAG